MSRDFIILTDSASDLDANYLKNLILENRPNIEVYINYIGPVIGAHAGQGTLALFYKGKNR